MNHDPHPEGRPTGPTEPIDDPTLASLVRGVVDDWHLPPQRLGTRT